MKESAFLKTEISVGYNQPTQNVEYNICKHPKKIIRYAFIKKRNDNEDMVKALFCPDCHHTEYLN